MTQPAPLALLLLLGALGAGCAAPVAMAPGAALAAANPLQASAAEDGSSFYVKAFGGFGTLEDAELDYTGGGSDASGDASFDSGFVAGVAVGYDLDSRWAVEGEFTYRTNDVDTFTAGGTTLADSGDFASTALMLNVFYTFDTDWRFEPYVGVGLGYTTEIDIDLAGAGFPGSRSFSGETPAAQYMVGAKGALAAGLDIFFEGRFFRAFNPEMDAESGAGTIETEYGGFNLLAGVTYSF